MMTPTLRSRPVATLTLCAICRGPVPIAAGRDLCLGCLAGESRPTPERPRVAGSEVTVRRRLRRRRLSDLTWRTLDAVAGGLRVDHAVVVRTVVQAGLVVAVEDGYRLTDAGREAHATRQAPARVRLVHDRLASSRERQARYRARVRALRGES